MSLLKNFSQILPQRLFPSNIRNKYQVTRNRKELNSIPKIECDTSNLRLKDDTIIDNLFNSPEIEKIWADSKNEINGFEIPDGSGGINPGDRKAIYFLISKLKPTSVLEVGTHIGASTIHISAALYKAQKTYGIKPNLTSVDILDVNSIITKPWLKYGARFSPAEMADKLNYRSFVSFITDSSLNYFNNCKQKFDFIFLDGSHSAATVYREIPTALKLLNQNGVILLHDYFPGMQPLWSDESVISGPYLAVERFRNEGIDITVLPLGELPWPTKMGSSITSLALLLRDGETQ